MLRNKITPMVLMVLCSCLVLILFSGQAQAADIDGIPEAVNNAMFDGGNLWAAKYFVSLMILVAIGMALAVARAPMVAFLVLLIGAMGFLIALGWMDYWILLLVGALVAAMFSKTITGWITGGENV